MWYLAEILLAEPRQTERRAYQCEACNVVFAADSADEAHRKAVTWGRRYAVEPPAALQFVGVSHLTTIGEVLGDGVEICGRFFESADVWDRERSPESLKAVVWEANQDTPLGELLSPAQVAQVKRASGIPTTRGNE